MGAAFKTELVLFSDPNCIGVCTKVKTREYPDPVALLVVRLEE